MADSRPSIRVDLHQMPHALYIRRTGEDWAGITNPKERKKLQNRLNKRASRLRKRKHGTREDTASPCSSEGSQYCAYDLVRDIGFSHCTEDDITQKRAILQHFADQALASYTTCSFRADHRLRVIQFNTVTAMTRNAAVLGFKFDWLVCASVSPFGPRPNRAATWTAAPSNLLPTEVQLVTEHHPWIDLFPLPKMRDNFLIAVTEILTPDEEQELFDDILEICGRSDWAGLVIWGEAWDVRNWEVTLPFLRRWGWLLRGCPEIFESTNYWRSQRGEKPIASWSS